MAYYATMLDHQYFFGQPDGLWEQRNQKRLAWRNERALYKRKCDMTGEKILSVYSPDAPFPVYSQEIWYGDGWDPCDYGQDFDFSRPFFDQFYELQCKVPRLAIILVRTQNCDYCNTVGDCKNCYLITGSINCEDCLYGSPYGCKGCIDSLILRNSQYCYECMDSDRLYECFYCQNCSNGEALAFCFYVEGSQNCFLCVGLRHKEFYILNQKYEPENYRRKVAELWELGAEKLLEMMNELKLRTPAKYMNGVNVENGVGDYLFNCKDCYHTFNAEKCENVDYCTQMLDVHNCLDCDYSEIGSFCYGTSGFYQCQNVAFCHWVWEINNCWYCSKCCANTSDCFGCISLKRKRYCVLNKQYTKEQYEELVPRIEKHMKKTGEWGEFFPMKYSPFAYNETVANEYYPKTRDVVLTEGLKWEDLQDNVAAIEGAIPSDSLPNIEDADEGLVGRAIKCFKSGRYYKFTSYEFRFYKRYKLSLPVLHQDERHKRRLLCRNFRKIFSRSCDRCGCEIRTTYSPENLQPVYCEKCYLGAVY